MQNSEEQMASFDLRERTKEFALRVIRLVESLPRTRTADVIGKQLLRSGTSVGANYRAACRVKSTADFVNKMSIVLEESDESGYWMDLIVSAKLMPAKRIASLQTETDELIAICVSSINTARRRKT
jgi:four helix bundle protein